ncbi:MAG: sigma-54 dependent transcriptional regulator [Nitrospirae bacterium]|nr:sigma-54 dependent transcriptional regulator [Nitrospirota bacterium]
MSLKIVIAEDEDITRKYLLQALKREGYLAVGAKNGREALEQIRGEHFDVLITDVRMPEMNGIELLGKVKEEQPGMEILVITGFGSIDAAVEAMKKGAYEYITKPFNLDELIMKVKNIHERRVLRRQNVALKAFFGMDKEVSLIARSEAMRKIVDIVEGMSDSDCNVLLTGESGSGKSLLARIIHFTSRRQGMPFLSLNCATVKDELLANELFGHEEGALAGAGNRKQGLVELADSGTLYLSGIPDLPLDVQTALLKVIEEGEVCRTGARAPVKINVRFIAAATRGVRESIAQGTFMEDLYYRLNVMELAIPPLRERREDIEPLCAYFLRRHLAGSHKKISGFARESIEILTDYSFPGNVRELENIVERAVIIEQGALIIPQSLPVSLRRFRIETFQPEGIRTIEEVTREYTHKVLAMVDGDTKKAAELLGVSELSLRRLLKEESL